MVDERVRELERLWRASGADDDEAAYLQALVRAGRLDPLQVELAAYTGSPAARRLVDAGAPADAHGWLVGYWRRGFHQGELLRASTRLQGAPWSPERLADAEASWTRWRTLAREAVRRVIAALARRHLPFRGEAATTGQVAAALRELDLWALGRVAARGPTRSEWNLNARDLERLGAESAHDVGAVATFGAGALISRTLEVVPADEVRSSVMAELLPWALGRGDPVRDRADREA